MTARCGLWIGVFFALFLAGAGRGGDAPADPPAAPDRAAATEADEPDADAPPPLQETPPPAPVYGAWAEWTVAIRAGEVLPHFLEPTPASSARRADERLRVRLTVIDAGEAGPSLRIDLLAGEERSTIAGAPYRPRAVWEDLADADRPASVLATEDASLTIAGTALSCRHEVVEVRSLDDAVHRFERWVAPQVALGPVRLVGPGVRIELQAFGDGTAPPPPFPFDPRTAAPPEAEAAAEAPSPPDTP